MGIIFYSGMHSAQAYTVHWVHIRCSVLLCSEHRISTQEAAKGWKEQTERKKPKKGVHKWMQMDASMYKR